MPDTQNFDVDTLRLPPARPVVLLDLVSLSDFKLAVVDEPMLVLLQLVDPMPAGTTPWDWPRVGDPIVISKYGGQVTVPKLPSSDQWDPLVEELRALAIRIRQKYR